MNITTNSYAEKQAQTALSLSSFNGFNLAKTKEDLATLLSHIRDGGMFLEYTQHDISHVDGMLGLVNDIIPESTKKILTPADWLMLVLAIYFHDLGMLITQEEYQNRNQNQDYLSFKDSYDNNRLITVSPDRKDIVMYQEYVRDNHGLRISEWLKNLKPDADNSIQKDLYLLLHDIDEDFIRDLAEVCRSHSEDFSKCAGWNAAKAYEQSKDSTVNLLYVAAILRTADLLHVNSERAPKLDYSIISPNDPYSKREWVKQKCVKRIQPRKEKNKEGIIDTTILPYRFEVLASFKEEDPYSHFMSYLDYAEKELKLVYDICKESKRRNANDYEFPWNAIVRDGIETIGFKSEKLRFVLDQNNILKLLIGHTLYNDANVVLRELTQNAIDACRLFAATTKAGSNSYTPRIEISWNSAQKILTVSDNGTGMDENIIVNFLLNVGSSWYRSEEFQKEYPTTRFTAISRFGIGLLTCFMISDDIEIVSSYYKERGAVYRLKIQSVHGNYLLRTDYSSEKLIDSSHGSTFTLKVRNDVNFEDLHSILSQWIYVPKCEISLNVDGNTQKIGHDNEEDVLKHYLATQSIALGEKYKLGKKQEGGYVMYYLLERNFFGEWVLSNVRSVDDSAPIGICVEGIMVDNDTPGFMNQEYLVLVNCHGKDAPSTNVARDRIEVSDNYSKLLKFIYSSYLSIIEDQVKSLSQRFSITWAIDEARHELDKLLSNSYNIHPELVNERVFDECVRHSNFVVYDDGIKFHMTSLMEMGDYLWTIDSRAFNSITSLIQEFQGPKQTALGILNDMMQEKLTNDGISTVYIDGNMHTRHYIHDLFEQSYEIVNIWVDSSNRQIVFKWGANTGSWVRVNCSHSRGFSQYRSSKYHDFYLIKNRDRVGISGVENSEQFIFSKYGVFMISEGKLSDFLLRLIEKKKSRNDTIPEILVGFIINLLEYGRACNRDLFDKYYRNHENYFGIELEKMVDIDEFLRCIQDTELKLIDFSKFYIHK